MTMQRRLPLYDAPLLVRRLAVAGVAVVILGVLGFRILSVRTPPPLTISTPVNLLSTTSRIITIEGNTAPGATITINGEEYTPDSGGAFSADIVLLPGVNTIAIESYRRHSRAAHVERTIHVHAANAPLALR
ncbi:MAG: hypothetical protein ABIG71_00925 [Candidatus Uhrbacteria bacterium]